MNCAATLGTAAAVVAIVSIVLGYGFYVLAPIVMEGWFDG